MSYYMGDYYRGDPGFLSNLLHGAVGAVGGFVTGGYPGAIAGAIQGYGAARAGAGSSRAGSQPGNTMPVPYNIGYQAGRAVVGAGRMVRAHPVLAGSAAAAGMGAAAYELGGGRGAVSMVGPGGRLKGYHMSKERRGRCPSPSHLVRNRHMNVCNVRALRRAARRAHGFLRISKKLVRYYTPKAHKGRAYIHARKKRA